MPQVSDTCLVQNSGAEGMNPCYPQILRTCVTVERRTHRVVATKGLIGVGIVIQVGCVQLVVGSQLLVELAGVTHLVEGGGLRYVNCSVDLHRVSNCRKAQNTAGI